MLRFHLIIAIFDIHSARNLQFRYRVIDSSPGVDETVPAHLDSEDGLEPWVDWIKRCTHHAEARMEKLGLDDWITIQRKRKWQWASKLANTTLDTWHAPAIRWDPSLMCATSGGSYPKRQTGHPKLRWIDDVNAYLLQQGLMSHCSPTSWINQAKDVKQWNELQDGYLSQGR